jgi:hypothetical protein
VSKEALKNKLEDIRAAAASKTVIARLPKSDKLDRHRRLAEGDLDAAAE